ncbi:MAG: hypothetical protein LBK99_21830 [Opitutaceae bacterium]|jgi:hypothetical protein|nr:hypothetical protein [Opitutaceae bacterium]
MPDGAHGRPLVSQRQYTQLQKHHRHPPQPDTLRDPGGKPAAGDKWIREQPRLCVDQANPAREFGNEINYALMSIGMGDTIKERERANRIEKYLGWVRAIRRYAAPRVTSVRN